MNQSSSRRGLLPRGEVNVTHLGLVAGDEDRLEEAVVEVLVAADDDLEPLVLPAVELEERAQGTLVPLDDLDLLGLAGRGRKGRDERLLRAGRDVQRHRVADVLELVTLKAHGQ